MAIQRRNFRGRRFWTKVVREWRESGKSQREFASSRGVPPSTLSKWAGRLREREAAPDPMPVVAPATFIEVAPAERPAAVAPTGPLVRLLVGNAVAEFSQLPPPEYLAAVGLYAEGGRC